MPAITKPFLGRVKPAPGAANRDIGYEERRKAGTYPSELREKCDLTQEALGRILGVRNTYISAVELGRASISPERYADFARALGVSPEVFGKRLLRHYNPWLYVMLFDDPALQAAAGGRP